MSAGGLRQHEDGGRPRGRKAMLHLRRVAQRKEKKKTREQREPEESKDIRNQCKSKGSKEVEIYKAAKRR